MLFNLRRLTGLRALMATARRGRGRGQVKSQDTSTLICGDDNVQLLELECDLCHLQFSKQDDLLNHKMSGHPEFYEFECGQCDDEQLFGRLQDLERHFKSVHMGMGEMEETTAQEEQEEISNLEKEVDEAVSQPIDMEEGNYENSERGDDDEDHFEQDGGNSDDDDDDDGGEHGGNAFKCPFCPKSYPWKSELTIHLRSHTGEKPYKCEECGQAFSVFRSMVDHQKRHNKKYEYFCEVVGCGKGFVKKQDRDRHEVKGHVPVHLRQDFKKSQCEFCGKGFANSTHLKIHVNAVHGKGPGYPCHLCDKSFGHASSLRSHLQSKKHGGTGLSFRNKKKNKPSATTGCLEESVLSGGNLPSISVPIATPQPRPPPQPVIYPNASHHPQFTPANFHPPLPPPPQSLIILEAAQIPGTVTLQDAFQMAYGIGGGVPSATGGYS